MQAGQRILLFLLLALTAVRAHAATWHVSNDPTIRDKVDFAAVQAAIDAATDGDTIIVHPGFYSGTIRFNGKVLHLRSSAPGVREVTETTILHGSFAGSTIRFLGTEHGAIVEGFTITGGSAENGGGIHGGSTPGARATIRYNIIANNTAELRGGGIYGVQGGISGNTIRGNFATEGGGLANCHFLVSSNEISGNRAAHGAGAFRCSADFTKNLIADNSAFERGGALHTCSGTIEDNVIELNDADEGGALIFCSGLVRGNVIRQNRALRGGGLYSCRATIEDNLIYLNRAIEDGGALYQCNHVIRNNWIAGNLAGDDGGAFYGLQGSRLLDNWIWQNRAGIDGGAVAESGGLLMRGNRVRENEAINGGAVASSDGLFEQNYFEGNRATAGGAFWRVSGEVRSSLIVANSARRGAAFDAFHGIIQNNTITRNFGPLDHADQPTTDSLGAALFMEGAGVLMRANIFEHNGGITLMTASAETTRTDRLTLEGNLFHEPDHAVLSLGVGTRVFASVGELEAGYEHARGNLAGDPLFVAPLGPDGELFGFDDNDFRLAAGSPAIGRGSPLVMTVMPAWDLDGFARLTDLAADLGAWQFESRIDSDGDGLDDAHETAKGMDPHAIDSDGDGAADSMELLRGTSPLAANPAGERRLAPGGLPLQLAVLQAFNGETLVLEPGIYTGPVRIDGKNVAFRGTAPMLSQVVDATILDAGGAGSVLRYSGGQDARSLVEGLTLRHGRAAEGSAILASGAPAAVRHNRIHGNAGGTGSIARTHGPVEHNLFHDNTGVDGAGLANCGGPISLNTFVDNYATRGAALFTCTGPARNNTFERNRALLEGGAVYLHHGALTDNWFVGNQARHGGAVARATGEVARNQFIENRAFETGGAIAEATRTVDDNVFTSNTAQLGGALTNATASVRRNRFVGNRAEYGAGAIYGVFGPVENNHFESNHGYSGGAIVNGDENGRIVGNTFIGNSAQQSAGALGVLLGEIVGNTFSGNIATDGGAVFDCDGPIRDNAFLFNHARNRGGALFECGGPIEGNRFESNSALVDGGAVFRPAARVVNNRFAGNSAGRSGGAIFEPNAEVFGNLFQINVALHGGAIQGGRGDVRNNTIAGNWTPQWGIGGGLHNVTGAIENNIFWGNLRYAIYNAGEVFRPRVVRRNAFWQNWDGHYVDLLWSVYTTVAELEAAVPDVHDNLELDPRFVFPAGPDWNLDTYADNDFRLRPDSPLIDAGIDVTPPVTEDLLGAPRIAAGPAGGREAIDLGAFEFAGLMLFEPAAPVALAPGGTFVVRWHTQRDWSGDELHFRLADAGGGTLDLGTIDVTQGIGSSVLRIPEDTPSGVYVVRAYGSVDPDLWAQAPGEVLVQRTSTHAGVDHDWTQYR